MTFIGAVTQIKTLLIAGGLVTVTVQDASGVSETFLLWTLNDQFASFEIWIVRWMSLNLIRDAMARSLTATIISDDTSAEILSLTVA